jgi:1,4-dihydroxy-2-naphthoate octaprenyltransferase
MSNTITPNSLRAWLLAARPKTLTGAATPVLIGSALAYADGGFRWVPALLCLLFAFLMQTDANFINDLFDYLKGTDREDRLGPERACAQGWIHPSAMKRGILITTLLAALVGCSLLVFSGPLMIPVGLLCILFAFLYTAGPYPLAYHGWGDVLVLVFFGFVPVGCTYYVMCHDWTLGVSVASLACGLVIDLLLMINNYRDREQDRISGKRTIVVRLGKQAGERFYLWLGQAASLLCLYFLWEGRLAAALLPQLYLYPHFLTWRRMVAIGEGRELNLILGETSRNMLLFGILLAIGLCL